MSSLTSVTAPPPSVGDGDGDGPSTCDPSSLVSLSSLSLSSDGGDGGGSDLPSRLSPFSAELRRRSLAAGTYSSALVGRIRKQAGRRNCGVASCSMILAAGKPAGEPPMSEDEVFELDSAGAKAVVRSDVEAGGMCLDQFAALLRGFGKNVTVKRADDFPAAKLEADIAAATREGGRACVAVNYHMGDLGQGSKWGGHLSPLGALAPAAGRDPSRALLLDVWPETHACWPTIRRLHAAMMGEDAATGRSRGWVVVRDGAAAAADESPVVRPLMVLDVSYPFPPQARPRRERVNAVAKQLHNFLISTPEWPKVRQEVGVRSEATKPSFNSSFVTRLFRR